MVQVLGASSQSTHCREDWLVELVLLERSLEYGKDYWVTTAHQAKTWLLF